jgi:hypothetical protein
LVPFHDGRKSIRCKWVFRKNINLDGNVEKCKLKLVAEGYSHVEGRHKPTFHAKTKHIDMKYLFLRDMVEDGNEILEEVDTL